MDGVVSNINHDRRSVNDCNRLRLDRFFLKKKLFKILNVALKYVMKTVCTLKMIISVIYRQCKKSF